METNIRVDIDRTGRFNGLFQVWDKDGNELWSAEEQELQKLFEAAPELLNACKRLLEHAGIADASPEDIDGDDHLAESAARAAIAVAEGRK